MSDDSAAAKPEDPAFDSTSVTSKQFELAGLKFSWWAVDKEPAFVTVSSEWFGSKSGFAHKDAEALARELAGQIIVEYETKAEDVRKQLKARDARRTVR